MAQEILNQLQLRELFHLEFLRWFVRKANPDTYALKGGSNLRFFFGSIRYSEDMDLDIAGVKVFTLRENVMKILRAPALRDSLKPFGIEEIVPPDITKAKQTETTQRFKVHLITSAGEDLFTKIEFSRRGFKDESVIGSVSEELMRQYKMPPILVRHYGAVSAVKQKIAALAGRACVQARDIFDIFVLSAQANAAACEEKIIKRARQNLYEVTFEQFRDTVLEYLAAHEREVYASAEAWDEIRLKVGEFLEK